MALKYEAGKIDAHTTNMMDDASMTYSSKICIAKFSSNYVESKVLPAVDPMVMAIFKDDHFDPDELLNKLQPVSRAHRDIRGVYICIGKGPNDERSFYIGSTNNLWARFLRHQQLIRLKSKETFFHRFMAKAEWTPYYRVLATFASGVHQCHSYYLENVLILLFRSLDNSKININHNQHTMGFAEKVMGPVVDVGGIRRLNFALPMRQGIPLADHRVKICAICGGRSDSETPPTGIWFAYDSANPWEKRICSGCWHQRHRNGVIRTPADQQRLEAIQRAQIIRATWKGKNPARCDWCGVENGIEGHSGQDGHTTAILKQYAICVCGCDYDRCYNSPHSDLWPPRNPVHLNLLLDGCEVCDRKLLPREFEYIPYPVKKFVCRQCNKKSGQAISNLLRSQSSWSPITFIEAVVAIQKDPSLIPASMRDPGLLQGQHHIILSDMKGEKPGALIKQSINVKKRKRRFVIDEFIDTDTVWTTIDGRDHITWESLARFFGPITQPYTIPKLQIPYDDLFEMGLKEPSNSHEWKQFRKRTSRRRDIIRMVMWDKLVEERPDVLEMLGYGALMNVE